jgi:thiol-disulfide isomerase/thioredoxin
MLRAKTIKIVPVLLLLLVCSLYAICQPHHFTLKIHFDDPSVKTLGIGEAYFYKFKPYYAAKIKLDSSGVHNDTYLFEGTTLYPTAIRMWPLGNSKHFNKLIFIDTGYQELTLIEKDSSYIIRANTNIEKEHQKFLSEMGIKTIDDQIDGEKLLGYVQKNPGSYVALFAIINQAFNYPYLPVFKKINNAFDQKIKQTTAFQYYLNLYKPITISAIDTDFLGINQAGEKITLSALKEKNFILLDFWASWCGPCRQMIPHLKDLHQKYHSKGFEIISLSFDEDSTEWKKAVKQEGIQSWFNLFAGQYYSVKNNPNGNANKILRKYNVAAFPTTILIDKQGNITGRYIGYSKDEISGLDKKLAEIFR